MSNWKLQVLPLCFSFAFLLVASRAQAATFDEQLAKPSVFAKPLVAPVVPTPAVPAPVVPAAPAITPAANALGEREDPADGSVIELREFMDRLLPASASQACKDAASREERVAMSCFPYRFGTETREKTYAYGISQPAVDIYWLDLPEGEGDYATVKRRVWGRDLPTSIRCSTADVRIFHFCVEPRIFEPSARVYFDTGNDDEGEVDLFDNGSLNASINVVSAFLPFRFGRSGFSDSWRWGPFVGVGLSAEGADQAVKEETSGDESMEEQGGDAEDDVETGVTSSDAPVVYLSGGVALEYRLSSLNNAAVSIEAGVAKGWSADELFKNNDDTAVFVGIKIDIPTGNKK